MSPLEREITQLADAINVIEDEQKFFFGRERAARDSFVLSACASRAASAAPSCTVAFPLLALVNHRSK